LPLASSSGEGARIQVGCGGRVDSGGVRWPCDVGGGGAPSICAGRGSLELPVPLPSGTSTSLELPPLPVAPDRGWRWRSSGELRHQQEEDGSGARFGEARGREALRSFGGGAG
jgi:hypothetical protein